MMARFTGSQVLRFKRALPFTTYLLLVAFAFISYGTKADSAQNTHKFEQFANNVKQNSKQTEIRVGYQKGTAKILETATGVKAENWEWTFQRRPNFGVIYMNDQIVKEQQQMADLFFNLKLVPKPVQVKEAVWKP